MKRLIFTGVIAMALTAGCSKADNLSMTQPIAVTTAQVQPGLSQPEESRQGTDPESLGALESQASFSGSQAAETGVQQTAPGASLAGPTGDIETDRENYYRLKAEKEATELDIDILEASFRVGGLDQGSFRSQKRALEEQEELLEMQEEILEDTVEHSYYREQSVPQGDMNSLLGELQKANMEKHTAEDLCDQLEVQYRNGQIAREDFISQYQEAARREDEADAREEVLEDALEMMGWDD